ncbi:MAG: tRNA lysidine(34) synthetase TilS [Campylobacterota bacterium]|nr:tRNA lysidine(34) synthetase TilS [Campylobacterota bacterium]
MLDSDALKILRESRNLLAFSGGLDSTALFHLLIDAEIPFDIVHVNYHTRQQSDDEAIHAKELALTHHKRAYLYDSTPITSNFEAQARKIRYQFFDTCITENHYDTLLTAHQLGDRLEWFLMQLSKGAGLYELMGMKSIDVREHYTLIRPLLHVNKEALKTYLLDKEVLWFEDESNHDERYKRNYFRHHFSDPLLAEFSQGLAKSFHYLDEDAKLPTIKAVHVKQLSYFKSSQERRHNLVHVDTILKQRGFIMRQGDKEILKSETSHVVGRKYSVCITDNYTFIAPYAHVDMPKIFKEKCRTLRIPKILRPYLFDESAAFESVASLLSAE